MASELARSSTSYKDAFVPTAFSTAALESLFFLSFPSPARPLCLRPRRTPLSPRHGPIPHRRIRRDQSEKCLVATGGSPPSATSSHRLSPPWVCPRHGVNRVPGFLGPQRVVRIIALDAISLLPLLRIHPTPYVSTAVDKSRFSTFIGCFTDTSSPCRSPPWLVWWARGWTIAYCAATKPMEKWHMLSLFPHSRMAPQFVEAGLK